MVSISSCCCSAVQWEYFPRRTSRNMISPYTILTLSGPPPGPPRMRKFIMPPSLDLFHTGKMVSRVSFHLLSTQHGGSKMSHDPSRANSKNGHCAIQASARFALLLVRCKATQSSPSLEAKAFPFWRPPFGRKEWLWSNVCF